MAGQVNYAVIGVGRYFQVVERQPAQAGKVDAIHSVREVGDVIGAFVSGNKDESIVAFTAIQPVSAYAAGENISAVATP